MVAAFVGPPGPPPPPVFPENPQPRRRPPWVWLSITLVLLVTVVIAQRPAVTPKAVMQQKEAGTLVEPPRSSPDIALAKMVLAFQHKKIGSTDFGELMMQQLDPPASAFAPAAGAKLPAEDARVAMMMGKLGRTERMKEKFQSIAAGIDPKSPLHGDMKVAERIVAGEAVTTDEEDGLIARHGWFARVLLDDGAGGTIAQAKKDGEKLLVVGMVAMVVFAVLFLAGLVSLVVVIVLLATGKVRRYPTPWRGVPGLPDSTSLWVQTFTMFLAGFLALKVVSQALAWGVVNGYIGFMTLEQLIWVSLIGQWALVPLVFWPRLRGLSRHQFGAEGGWHRGRGFVAEIGAGVVSYLAIIPVFVVCAVIVGVLYQIFGGNPNLEDNPVMELAKGSTLQVAVLFLLVTIWAPVVEESMFRGAIYRSVRPWGGFFLAALISAIIFAVMHAYIFPQLVMVGLLGFFFAIMREYRGSLIASMTAHAIHNGLIFTLAMTAIPLLEG